MFGWGGAGVASGQDVLERVAPDHRERRHLFKAQNRVNQVDSRGAPCNRVCGVFEF